MSLKGTLRLNLKDTLLVSLSAVFTFVCLASEISANVDSVCVHFRRHCVNPGAVVSRVDLRVCRGSSLASDLVVSSQSCLSERTGGQE